MTLAGIELAYLVKEIGEKTEGCYVNNIYGINRNSLLFKLRHPDKPDVMLMISSIGMWTASTSWGDTMYTCIWCLTMVMITDRIEKI